MSIGRVAFLINDNALGFSQKVCVDLLPDTLESHVTSGEGTELPGGVSAPEEASLGEVFLSNVVDANGHEVVVFDS